MPQKTEPKPDESIFGPGEAEIAESILWDDRVAYCGDTNEEWITFDQGNQLSLSGWR